jgi:phosphoglycerate dehydrogenase-like enzyme
LKDADAAIIGIETIDDSLLKNTPSLKIISKYGVGLDNIVPTISSSTHTVLDFVSL